MKGRVLFIYGTLRQGCRANYLMDGAEYLGMATTKAKLVCVNRYPGLIFSEDKCYGELYRVSDRHIKELDKYEGCEEKPTHYLRLNIDVISGIGVQKADVYVFQLYDKDRHPDLIGNDWLKYMNEHPELNHFEQ